MTVRAQIAHAMPGRVRVRLPDYRGRAEELAAIEQQLLHSALFDRVRANAATGSLLLEFAGAPENMLMRLAEQLPFEIELEKPGEPGFTDKAPGAWLSDPLRLVSGPDVNPMLLAATLFGSIGVVQVFRGEIMLPALSAFWYATHAFRLARAPAGAGAGAGS